MQSVAAGHRLQSMALTCHADKHEQCALRRGGGHTGRPACPALPCPALPDLPAIPLLQVVKKMQMEQIPCLTCLPNPKL